MFAWSVSDFAVSAMDVLLGWSLRWSQDAALITVALATSLVLTFVRVFTTNQQHLKRCRSDKRRLKQLLRQAKRVKDKGSVRRYRRTLGMLGLEAMRSEGKPLLVSVLPVILLATWAFGRLSFVPPQPGEDLTVTAYFPLLSVGGLAHIVPQDGLKATDGWVKRVREDVDQAGSTTNSLASWCIRAQERATPYVLQIRHGGQTVESQIVVDGYRYACPVERHEDSSILAIQQSLKPYKPFGVLGGIAKLGLTGWIIGYLLIAIACTTVLKRFLRIA